MAGNWHRVLRCDPRPALLETGEDALDYFTRRDVLGEAVPAVEILWELPVPLRLVRQQQNDGSWKYRGQTSGAVPGQNYSLLETFRSLGVLVEQYSLTCAHPAVQKAAEYVLSCQTAEGDIRGILGNQYMPYYHGALLELLIKAGLGQDLRVRAGLAWLLSVRQDDDGWIVPAQAVPSKERTSDFWSGAPVPPDHSRPHAHLATGMVLRALAAHPEYRTRPESIAAGLALKSRFFRADRYNDRKAPSYWFKFQFPFWWSNLLTALDSLAQMGFDQADADIARGLDWFSIHQENDGLWPTGYGSGRKAKSNRCWVGLAICRMLKNFYD